MRQYIEPFVNEPIWSSKTEEDTTSYYSETGELLAEVYFHEGTFFSATFYRTIEETTPITKEQAEQIAKKVQTVFQQEQLVIESIEQQEEGFYIVFQLIEPIYNVLIPGTGMTIMMSSTGFMDLVTIHDNDVTIHYPEKMISKEEAREILQQQPILTLGIAPELGWQYVYKQNYDLYGIDPDGKVRLWSEDEALKDASFQPLPAVGDIPDFDSFLKGDRNGIVEETADTDEKRWFVETEDVVELQEDVFVRACKVVKHLVGDNYEHYFVEQYPTLI